MRILFLGDIVARLGRETTGKVLPKLLKTAKISLVFANAENIAHGKGATTATIEEVRGYGVDYYTSGNHIFWRSEILEGLDGSDLPVLRPANYDEDVPGRGWTVIDTGKQGKVLLINLQGRILIQDDVSCPFRTVDRILKEQSNEDFSAIIVDMHAEVTSEKVALGWYLDGRVSAVVGTHTHVPTSDTWVMPKGTAYVTDIGMIGAQYSVLGVKPEIIIPFMKYPMPQRFEWVEEGPAVFNSVLLDIDRRSGKAKSIKRLDKIVD